MAPSYIHAEQTVASFVINASNSGFSAPSTPYTNLASSPDWSCTGAGTALKSATSSGVSCYITIDMKWDSVDVASSFYIAIVRNGNYLYKFPIASSGTGAGSTSVTLPFPLICSPGEYVRPRFQVQSGSQITMTNLTIGISIANT